MATRYFVLLSVVLAGLDQLTKYLVRERLVEGVRYEIIPEFFRITLNYNKGIAWGMLPEWSEYFTYFAIVMVLIILLILRKLEKDEVWFKIALAFQMAGAIGNMTDRLIRQKVTDFIDVTLFPNTEIHRQWEIFGRNFEFNLPYDWPIFNLADSFVVIGTIVLVVVLMHTTEKAPAVPGSAQTARGMAELGGLGQDDDYSTHPDEMGSISHEEALSEIEDPSTSDKLRPFEDEERERKLRDSNSLDFADDIPDSNEEDLEGYEGRGNG